MNYSKGSMFIESADTLSYMKIRERLFKLLDRMIEKVDEANVVQVIIDNDASYALTNKKRISFLYHFFTSNF